MVIHCTLMYISFVLSVEPLLFMANIKKMKTLILCLGDAMRLYLD